MLFRSTPTENTAQYVSPADLFPGTSEDESIADTRVTGSCKQCERQPCTPYTCGERVLVTLFRFLNHKEIKCA